MPFNVILKQHSDNSNPNHFEYQSLVAFNTSLDAEMIKTSIDNIMNGLTKNPIEATYFVFKLENLEESFDESVIGRVVTTRQLIDILKTDEFIDDRADCFLLMGPMVVNHYLYIHEGVVYDTGLDDEEIEWIPEDFIEHYANSLWRICH